MSLLPVISHNGNPNPLLPSLITEPVDSVLSRHSLFA
jgi:hypothetical protein